MATADERGRQSNANSTDTPGGVATRVVALAPNAAEIICGLGACDRLIGVSSYCTYPLELAGVPKIGGLRDPDLELILTLRPDLLILRGKTPALEQMAAAHHIRIYDDGVETLGDLYRTVHDLGSGVGRIAEAAAMVADIQRSLNAVAVRIGTRPRVRVLLTMRSPTALEHVLSVGRGTFIHELIEIAGGQNVFDDQATRYPTVSIEEIVGRNPAVIIEAMSGRDLDDAKRRELLDQWQRLDSIDAVRNGRIHFLTDDFLLIPSQRVAQSAELLARVIHGDGESPTDESVR
ncbi:MAG: ABC transporter substrate-binding protein [Phycisphaerales bacterium]|nr:ABC transporter substrate-binding protein [Phycisphaerales bacterium]